MQSEADQRQKTNSGAGDVPSSSKQQHGVSARHNLFDDIYIMSQRAFFIYCLADMRALAKAGKLEDGDCMLQFPVTLRNFSHVMRTNKELIKTEYPEGYEMYGPWLEDFLEKLEMEGLTDLNKIYFVEFDDLNSQGECVYLLGVDHYQKHVVVVFRGSVTVRDWCANTQVDLVSYPNPARDLTEPPHNLSRNILLHHGFAEYFYGMEHNHSIRDFVHKKLNERASSKSKNKKPDDEVPREEKDAFTGAKGNRNKMRGLVQRVEGLISENPTYQLFVSGHSLGGALASLFAMEAACAEGIPKPVTCISVASPKLGNVFFRQTIAYLETSRRLRFVRVSNAGDVVTLLPDQGSWYPFSPDRSYHHVGMRIKLLPPSIFGSVRKTAQVTYPRGFGDNPTKIRLYQAAHYCSCCLLQWISVPFVCVCPCLAGSQLLKSHSCKEYAERLLGCRTYLEQQSLDDHYNRKVQADLYPEVVPTEVVPAEVVPAPNLVEGDDPSYSA